MERLRFYFVRNKMFYQDLKKSEVFYWFVCVSAHIWRCIHVLVDVHVWGCAHELGGQNSAGGIISQELFTLVFKTGNCCCCWLCLKPPCLCPFNAGIASVCRNGNFVYVLCCLPYSLWGETWGLCVWKYSLSFYYMLFYNLKQLL